MAAALLRVHNFVAQSAAHGTADAGQMNATARPMFKPDTATALPDRGHSGEVFTTSAPVVSSTLDLFTVVYWGIFIAALLLLEYLVYKYPINRKSEKSPLLPPDEVVCLDPTSHRFSGIMSCAGPSRLRPDDLGDMEADGEVNGRAVVLPETMWSLLMVANVGQARFANGWPIPPWLVGTCDLAMASLQFFTIYLFVHDLNPHAKPVTTTNSLASPWLDDPWSVNCCKWVMIFYFTVFLTGDAGNFMRVFKETVCLHRRHFQIPYFVVMPMICTQYAVLLALVYGGAVAILCFQAVPDIIYCSLAMTFISHVDDMIWTFLTTGFAMEASFTIRHKAGDESSVPEWLEVILRMLMIFPVAFGFYIMAHAWHTKQIPTHVLHHSF